MLKLGKVVAKRALPAPSPDVTPPLCCSLSLSLSLCYTHRARGGEVVSTKLKKKKKKKKKPETGISYICFSISTYIKDILKPCVGYSTLCTICICSGPGIIPICLFLGLGFSTANLIYSFSLPTARLIALYI